ncbi:MAG TPA: hypothetical protein VGF46_04115 [Gaiellales bacterium]|jgi:hypothetical protein
MSDFVDQCRREWRRLGVPPDLADEMAAELASDLEEAEGEGISANDLLGSRSSSDARSFAASWATERGIIPSALGSAKVHRRPLVLIAFTAVAAIALLFAALALLTGQPQVSVDAARATGAHLPIPPAGGARPPGPGQLTLLHTSASAPVEWILLFLAIVALAFAAWLWSTHNRQRALGVPTSP